MEGNFGGGKRWRIWQMIVDSPNLFQPKFIHLKKVLCDKIYLHCYVGMSMLILKYFSRTPAIVQDQGLPEPTSSLSNFVPPKAIESTNTEVEQVKNKGPRGTRSAPYLILTSTQRFQVGKRAAERGVTEWLMSQICRVA